MLICGEAISTEIIQNARRSQFESLTVLERIKVRIFRLCATHNCMREYLSSGIAVPIVRLFGASDVIRDWGVWANERRLLRFRIFTSETSDYKARRRPIESAHWDTERRNAAYPSHFSPRFLQLNRKKNFLARSAHKRSLVRLRLSSRGISGNYVIDWFRSNVASPIMSRLNRSKCSRIANSTWPT